MRASPRPSPPRRGPACRSSRPGPRARAAARCPDGTTPTWRCSTTYLAGRRPRGGRGPPPPARARARRRRALRARRRLRPHRAPPLRRGRRPSGTASPGGFRRACGGLRPAAARRGPDAASAASPRRCSSRACSRPAPAPKDEALRLLRQADGYGFPPLDSPLMLLAADCLYELQEPALAAQAYREVVKRAPPNAEARLRLGVCAATRPASSAPPRRSSSRCCARPRTCRRPTTTRGGALRAEAQRRGAGRT